MKNKNEYEELSLTIEKRVLDYFIEKIINLSDNIMEIIVKQKETFESPEILENRYRFKLVKEKGTWKIDGMSDFDKKHEYLP